MCIYIYEYMNIQEMKYMQVNTYVFREAVVSISSFLHYVYYHFLTASSAEFFFVGLPKPQLPAAPQGSAVG